MSDSTRFQTTEQLAAGKKSEFPQLGDLPVSTWMQIYDDTAKALFEAGKPVLVSYIEEWSTPGGGGIDHGWMFVHDAKIRTTSTWDARAPSPVLDAVFGRGEGYLYFYCSSEESVPDYWERLAEIREAEAARWAALQAQGYVRIWVSAYPDGSRGINVDSKAWPHVIGAENFGFPFATILHPVIDEVHRDHLRGWYEAAMVVQADTWLDRPEDLQKLSDGLGSSVATELLKISKIFTSDEWNLWRGYWDAAKVTAINASQIPEKRPKMEEALEVFKAKHVVNA